MTDERIIQLYWDRNEKAIKETENKYKHYLFKISFNILANKEDCQESINDTYLKTWNSIPPQRPKNFSIYLAKIIRERSIDILRSRERIKRKASNYTLSLEELKECVSDNETAHSLAELKELGKKINLFLSDLSKESRMIFISRYFYAEPIRVVALRYKITIPKVKTVLLRTRAQLKEYLESEGYNL